MIAPRVSSVAYRLWKYLESLKRYEGWISICVRRLAQKYKRSESTVKRWFGELYAAGILASKRRGPHPPVYTILIPTTDTCKQLPLITYQEEPEKESGIRHHQPPERPRTRDDVASPAELELQRLAGIPRKGIARADRAFLEALEQPLEVIRGGILLGRARKLASNANQGRDEPIRSLRYFAGPIREASNGLASGYVQHLEQFIRRHSRAS